jgi:tetratricopeptide (TPR) repeat protein
MSISRLSQLLAFYEANPKDSFILFALAKEYEKLGDDDKALYYYRLSTDNDPAYVGVYYHLGKLFEKTGDPATAFSVYTKGMDIARQAGDQHALNELAEAKLNLGDEEDWK